MKISDKEALALIWGKKGWLSPDGTYELWHIGEDVITYWVEAESYYRWTQFVSDSSTKNMPVAWEPPEDPPRFDSESQT